MTVRTFTRRAQLIGAALVAVGVAIACVPVSWTTGKPPEPASARQNGKSPTQPKTRVVEAPASAGDLALAMVAVSPDMPKDAPPAPPPPPPDVAVVAAPVVPPPPPVKYIGSVIGPTVRRAIVVAGEQQSMAAEGDTVAKTKTKVVNIFPDRLLVLEDGHEKTIPLAPRAARSPGAAPNNAMAANTAALHVPSVSMNKVKDGPVPSAGNVRPAPGAGRASSVSKAQVIPPGPGNIDDPELRAEIERLQQTDAGNPKRRKPTTEDAETYYRRLSREERARERGEDEAPPKPGDPEPTPGKGPS